MQYCIEIHLKQIVKEIGNLLMKKNMKQSKSDIYILNNYLFNT
jgi:hypothetical protein